MKRMIFCFLLAFALAAPARAQSPAARVGDMTNHAIATGSVNVFIGP